MPRIISLRPDTTLVFTIDGPFVTFGYAPSVWTKTPCLGLVGRFCPNPLAVLTHQGNIQDLMYLSELPLARIPMGFSEGQGGVEALRRVASVMTEGGTANADKMRMREAFSLFKNGKVNEEQLEKGIVNTESLIDAYYDIRGWLATGCEEKKVLEIEIAKTSLILVP